MNLESLSDYYEGRGCRCWAYGEGECGCDADWTPKKEKIIMEMVNASDDEIRLFYGGDITSFEINIV